MPNRVPSLPWGGLCNVAPDSRGPRAAGPGNEGRNDACAWPPRWGPRPGNTLGPGWDPRCGQGVHHPHPTLALSFQETFEAGSSEWGTLDPPPKSPGSPMVAPSLGLWVCEQTGPHSGIWAIRPGCFGVGSLSSSLALRVLLLALDSLCASCNDPSWTEPLPVCPWSRPPPM